MEQLTVTEKSGGNYILYKLDGVFNAYTAPNAQTKIYEGIKEHNAVLDMAGIIGITKSVAKELGSRGITVNAVAPGFVGTEMVEAMTDSAKEAMTGMIPFGRIGEPEEIAAAVAFLASDAARYITGQVLAVDGGMSIGC